MEKSPVITVGKGTVTLDSSLSEYAGKGYYIVLRLDSKQGPCNDVDCERILYAVAEITQLPDESYRIFAGGGFFLAVDPPMYSYIDKDRQNAIIKKSRLGKITVKGIRF